ncbi:hypothetical protein KDA23_05225, partial [Candidatus Saccharibacteria bacterium]|nr:hypothetical protein [Candidatus Saccharibacteria bacterium]
MSKTFGGSGTRTTWTISVWVKRCVADQNHMIWSAGSNGFAWFQSNNTIQWSFTSGGVQLVTTRLFRDVGSWMHLLFVADTPDGTSTERMRLYVNGVREAVSFTSTPSASQSGDWFNSANTHYIGRYTTPYYAQMFMANFQCVDGTDLSPSSFGEFKNGIWVPKSYSGSYGTRGFFLDFGNSADLDADVSGNGNDFTATSMSAANQVVDTPTNNEAVIDTLQSKSTGWTSIGAI